VSGLRAVEAVVVLVAVSVVEGGCGMESCGVDTDSVGHAAGVSEGAGTLEVVDKVMSIDVVEK
jgi:hypothetical protein